MANIQRRGIRNDLERLHNEMDDLFGSFFGRMPRQFPELKMPAIDIYEEKDKLVVKAEIPGCKAEDIDVSVHGDTLSITGEKKQEYEQKEEGYYAKERSFGKFRRDLTLPFDVDPEKVDAKCKDGVLHLALPKAETSKSHKIQIKSE